MSIAELKSAQGIMADLSVCSMYSLCAYWAKASNWEVRYEHGRNLRLAQCHRIRATISADQLR